jgi:hypothetical protein
MTGPLSDSKREPSSVHYVSSRQNRWCSRYFAANRRDDVQRNAAKGMCASRGHRFNSLEWAYVVPASFARFLVVTRIRQGKAIPRVDIAEVLLSKEGMVDNRILLRARPLSDCLIGYDRDVAVSDEVSDDGFWIEEVRRSPVGPPFCGPGRNELPPPDAAGR